ncbi:MAG: SDR family NAD(P)-dependent oxidoreductase [Bacteroidetes bacterium]|nr:SDR family NAD(P)-dependent oxidoreductase [Bacteroidota bacterium]
MYNPFSLKDKTIFITGASSGIGRAVAIECSKLGADVIISGRNPERLQETFDALEGHNNKQFLAELQNHEDVNSLIDQIPLLDGIVFCAGYTKTLPFQFINEDELNAIMRINFIAPTLIAQSLLKKKKIKNGASIVFISSISGMYISFYGNSMYSASKGAINGMVKGMALDLANKNIRVNTVTPGMIQSNIINTGIITEEQINADIKKYPLKRYGNPNEVAYAVIYLLSDATTWITGSNLLIDGGYTLT